MNCVDRNSVLLPAAGHFVTLVMIVEGFCTVLADVWFYFRLSCSLRASVSPFICCVVYFGVMALDVQVTDFEFLRLSHRIRLTNIEMIDYQLWKTLILDTLIIKLL
jgi:hypothetical protein